MFHDTANKLPTSSTATPDSSMDDNECTAFIPKEVATDEDLGSTNPTRKLSWLHCLILLSLISNIVLTIVLVVQHLQRIDQQIAPAEMAKQTSFYTPVFDQISIPYRTIDFDVSFFDSTSNKSLFKRLPSPEVDAAWHSLAYIGQTHHTEEEIVKMGKDPAITVRDKDDPAKFPGMINVFHELHCLNLIRKNLHRDYYWPAGIRSPMHWLHLYHCIDLIRMELMCSASVGIITYNWVESQMSPVPDFAGPRVCKDFDMLAAWQKDNLRPLEDTVSQRNPDLTREIPDPWELAMINEQDEATWVWTHDDPAIVGLPTLNFTRMAPLR